MKQWGRLAPLLPEQKRTGRRRRDDREVLNGILWILKTGAPWKDLPTRYPPYQTCHRRFQAWSEDDVLSALLEELARDLYKQGDVDLSNYFVDDTVVPNQETDSGAVIPGVEALPKLWPSQMLLVFRSPLVHGSLSGTRSGLSAALNEQGLSPILVDEL